MPYPRHSRPNVMRERESTKDTRFPNELHHSNQHSYHTFKKQFLQRALSRVGFFWIPAFAGMTACVRLAELLRRAKARTRKDSQGRGDCRKNP
ncbi:MAG: hypothetical protein ACJAXL_001482 [Alphaproteobacteria bacterium]|jgi:hypothetical protein